jgi:hypothetical protein
VAGQGFRNDELQETLLAFRLHKAWTGEYSVEAAARLGDLRDCPILIPIALSHCEVPCCQAHGTTSKNSIE